MLVTGLGIVIGFCATGLTGHPAASDGINALLVPAGVLLTGLGLVLTLPLLSYLLAKRLARSGNLALNLAMRRNEVEPGSTMRVVTGLVLLVFSVFLAQGVLVELSQVSHSTSPTQEYGLTLSQLTRDQQQRLRRIPGVDVSVLVMNHVDDVQSDADDNQADALVATCAQLAALTRRVEGCVDGRVMRMSDPNIADTPFKDSVYTLEKDGKRTALHLPEPKDTVLYASQEVTNVSDAHILIPPGKLPSGAVPASATLILASASDPATVRAVLDRIGTIAPTADVEPAGVNVEALQQITVIETLLVLGMVMGLVIGVAAFLVSVTDRAVERRPQVTALALIGARTGTLRTVQCLQVVLPLTTGLLLALVSGKLAESAYLVTGGGEIFWDSAGLPLLLVATLGVLVVAIGGTLPVVGRHIDPELIRRD